MCDPVLKYMLSPFEGNIITEDPQGIKLYIQAKKEIYKKCNKLDISFSNAKYIIYHFISLAKKYE